MPITILDVKSISQNSLSTSVGFTTNPANGDLIVVFVSSDNLAGATINLPTDSKGNTYTRLGTTQIGSTGSGLGMFYCANIVGGAGFSVTSHLSAVRFHALVAWAITGVGPAPYNGDWISEAGLATNAGSGPSGVAPPGQSIFLGGTEIDGSAVPTDGVGWSTEGVNGFTAAMHTQARRADFSTNYDVFSEYKISSSVERASWTLTGTAWTAMSASFAAPGSAGGGGGSAGVGSGGFSATISLGPTWSLQP